MHNVLFKLLLKKPRKHNVLFFILFKKQRMHKILFEILLKKLRKPDDIFLYLVKKNNVFTIFALKSCWKSHVSTMLYILLKK